MSRYDPSTSCRLIRSEKYSTCSFHISGDSGGPLIVFDGKSSNFNNEQYDNPILIGMYHLLVIPSIHIQLKILLLRLKNKIIFDIFHHFRYRNDIFQFPNWKNLKELFLGALDALIQIYQASTLESQKCVNGFQMSLAFKLMKQQLTEYFIITIKSPNKKHDNWSGFEFDFIGSTS